MLRQKGVPLFWAVSVVAVFILGYSLAAPAENQRGAVGGTGAHKIMNEVNNIDTTAASTVRNELGSITYGVDGQAINIILDLNLPRHRKVGIKFMGPDQQAVPLGDMVSILKVGHVEQETSFVTVNDRL
ncbi:hypothetical protein, partial [Streptomyces sp. NPDC056154]|uniref:hypothetical protein n=1 Tax=Streptomyces sp. NPDC056154 TaxID=3345729 RepID=UPI0035DEDE27